MTILLRGSRNLWVDPTNWMMSFKVPPRGHGQKRAGSQGMNHPTGGLPSREFPRFIPSFPTSRTSKKMGLRVFVLHPGNTPTGY